jgi:hypothetical protein
LRNNETSDFFAAGHLRRARISSIPSIARRDAVDAYRAATAPSLEQWSARLPLRAALEMFTWSGEVHAAPAFHAAIIFTEQETAVGIP